MKQQEEVKIEVITSGSSITHTPEDRDFIDTLPDSLKQLVDTPLEKKEKSDSPFDQASHLYSVDNYPIKKTSDTYGVDLPGPGSRLLQFLRLHGLINKRESSFQADFSDYANLVASAGRTFFSMLYEYLMSWDIFFGEEESAQKKLEKELWKTYQEKIEKVREDDTYKNILNDNDKKKLEAILQKEYEITLKKEISALTERTKQEYDNSFWYEKRYGKSWLWKKKKGFFHLINLVALTTSFFGTIGLAKFIMIGIVGTFAGVAIATAPVTIATIGVIATFAAPCGLSVFAGLGLLRWGWFLGEDLYQYHRHHKNKTTVPIQLKHETRRHLLYFLSYAALLFGGIFLLASATAGAVASIIAGAVVTPIIVPILSCIGVVGLTLASMFMCTATTWRMVGESWTDSKKFPWSKSLLVGMGCFVLMSLITGTSITGVVLAFAFPQFSIPILLGTSVITGICTFLTPVIVHLIVPKPVTVSPDQPTEKQSLVSEQTSTQTTDNSLAQTVSLNSSPHNSTPLSGNSSAEDVKLSQYGTFVSNIGTTQPKTEKINRLIQKIDSALTYGSIKNIGLGSLTEKYIPMFPIVKPLLTNQKERLQTLKQEIDTTQSSQEKSIQDQIPKIESCIQEIQIKLDKMKSLLTPSLNISHQTL